MYDRKEFAVFQEAVTRTSKAMEKLGGKKSVVVLIVFCLWFLKCKSLLWFRSCAVRNSLLWRFRKLPSVAHLCHDLPSVIAISTSYDFIWSQTFNTSVQLGSGFPVLWDQSLCKLSQCADFHIWCEANFQTSFNQEKAMQHPFRLPRSLFDHHVIPRLLITMTIFLKQ